MPLCYHITVQEFRQRETVFAKSYQEQIDVTRDINKLTNHPLSY